MDIKEIIAELQKWQGENKENRGLVILANERIAISEGGGMHLLFNIRCCRAGITP